MKWTYRGRSAAMLGVRSAPLPWKRAANKKDKVKGAQFSEEVYVEVGALSSLRYHAQCKARPATML